MILYNITTKVDKDAAAEWVEWQLSEHIPEIMATKKFASFQLSKLIDQPDDEGITYVLQLSAENYRLYEEYIEHYAPALKQRAFEKWSNRFVSFRTIMEVVN